MHTNARTEAGARITPRLLLILMAGRAVSGPATPQLKLHGPRATSSPPLRAIVGLQQILAMLRRPVVCSAHAASRASHSNAALGRAVTAPLLGVARSCPSHHGPVVLSECRCRPTPTSSRRAPGTLTRSPKGAQREQCQLLLGGGMEQQRPPARRASTWKVTWRRIELPRRSRPQRLEGPGALRLP
jgi:hypothetical protein